MIVMEGDVIHLDELLYLYHLKESKEFRYYKLVPWYRKAHLFHRHSVIRSLDTFLYLETVGRPFRMTSRVMFVDCCIGGRHPSLVHLLLFFFLFFLFFFFERAPLCFVQY